MSLILNSGLPAGSTGLWWFAQGLENLGEAAAATGDAVLGGVSGNTSVLTGGEVVHDNAGDRTRLAVTPSDILSTTAITIMMGHRWTDTTVRNADGFGLDADTSGNRCGTHFLFNDGKAYWDFGGATEGTTRLSLSITKDTDPHVWGFTVGARGMEIWKDGTKITSNAATPTRGAGAQQYMLGKHNGAGSDLCAYSWFFIHTTQLSEALIGDISADPEATLTETAATAGSPWLTYAQMRRG